MPLVILDGPEAVGKSTIIDALLLEWGEPSMYRHWGPRQSWLEYCQPLFDDLQACVANPQLLVVWSRSWLSRSVYNKLLSQGQSVPSHVMMELDDIVLRNGGALILVTAPVFTLMNRRMQRLEREGSTTDHPLDPSKELTEFMLNVRKRKWRKLSGTDLVNFNVRQIMTMLVHRNPECRMIVPSETPVDLEEEVPDGVAI